MIEWHERGRHGWNYRTHPLGKNLFSWASPETLVELPGCFWGFAPEQGWASLFTEFQLFGRLGRETAKMLGYGYPTELEDVMVDFSRTLYTGKEGG